MDSPSLIIYPEIKATEVAFSALKQYLCSFYFRIDNETGKIHRNTLYTHTHVLQYHSNSLYRETPTELSYSIMGGARKLYRLGYVLASTIDLTGWV